jgi:uncharacterized protein (TIGR02271 family)
MNDHQPDQAFQDVARDPGAFDSGEVETLADGSISIPILEEELVVTKRVVVRERLIVHKDSHVEHRTVGAELRRERVEVREDGAPR